MISRVPLIAGNWKMNKDCKESIQYIKNFKKTLTKISNIEIFIAPPFTSLSILANILKGSNIFLGAQNVFWENFGAFTGEISASMIKDVGCKYVIIGHSERRQLFLETNKIINKKIIISLKADLSPVICIGETKIEKSDGKTFSVIEEQLEKGLENISAEYIKKIIIAYEPVWAIGSGLSASSSYAQKIHSYIRQYIEKKYSYYLAQNIRIIYGGSVNKKNIKNIMQSYDIDGVLVGGSSLDYESFSKLIFSAN